METSIISGVSRFSTSGNLWENQIVQNLLLELDYYKNYIAIQNNEFKNRLRERDDEIRNLNAVISEKDNQLESHREDAKLAAIEIRRFLDSTKKDKEEITRLQTKNNQERSRVNQLQNSLENQKREYETRLTTVNRIKESLQNREPDYRILGRVRLLEEENQLLKNKIRDEKVQFSREIQQSKQSNESLITEINNECQRTISRINSGNNELTAALFVHYIQSIMKIANVKIDEIDFEEIHMNLEKKSTVLRMKSVIYKKGCSKKNAKVVISRWSSQNALHVMSYSMASVFIGFLWMETTEDVHIAPTKPSSYSICTIFSDFSDI
uniref:Uncharacterized protein n=1 Tax=Caenorhabditis tropicalis TaxID=1561998 RepID=A0A1I7TC18_9PELO